jgi:hypothetical protein
MSRCSVAGSIADKVARVQECDATLSPQKVNAGLQKLY